MFKSFVFALVGVALLAVAAPASAAPAASPEKAFCLAYARFGDTPSYGNLTTVHAAAGKTGVKPASRVAYRRFEVDLLAGKPRTTLRADNATVYRTCKK